eukprot:5931679-Alexandrium_andersonii.AAC.1
MFEPATQNMFHENMADSWIVACEEADKREKEAWTAARAAWAGTKGGREIEVISESPPDRAAKES